MKKFLATTKGCLISYVVSNLFLILLSLIGLFFNIRELTALLSISAFFNFFVLIIMLKTELKNKETSQIKIFPFLLLSVGRFVLMSLGIVLGIVLLFFTKEESDTKFRFLYSLITLLPLSLTILTFYLKGTFEYE